MQAKQLKILIHIAGALVFLSLPVIFSPDVSQAYGLLGIPPFQRDFLGYLLVLLFFYANYFYFLPRLYFTRKHFAFTLALLVSFGAIATLPSLLIPWQPHGTFYHSHSWFREASHHLFQFAGVAIFSLLLQLNRRLKHAEKDKMKAELSYLRAQINPHFLFNTLNSIYSLAIQKSNKTPKAIVDLSNLMRYVTTEAHQEYVPLDNEIIYITNYINLQVIRLGETAKIDFRLTGKMDTEKITPLILIPFVENAFKYGINPERNALIRVIIEVTEGRLHIQVFNMKVNAMQPAPEERSGHGLQNTRNRLQALYPNKHQLNITDEHGEYTVDLKINLR